MGKGARLRTARRTSGLQDARQLRKIFRQDERGRGVPPTVRAYEAAAQRGHHLIGQALIARHTQRMTGLDQRTPHLHAKAYSCLAPISLLDRVLLEVGVSPNRLPVSYGSDWPEHLMWAVDSAVAAVRLLVAGQYVGAAAIARNQLERWLIHRMNNAGILQEEGESRTSLIARAWSSEETSSDTGDGEDPVANDLPPEALSSSTPEDHAHVYLSDATEICPPLLYDELSEFMHGRKWMEPLYWEAGQSLNGATPPAETGIPLGLVTDAISLTLREVRFSLAKLIAERGDAERADLLRNFPDRFSSPEADQQDQQELFSSTSGKDEEPAFTRPPLPAIMPLTPWEGLSPGVAKHVRRLAFNYIAVLNHRRPAGRLLGCFVDFGQRIVGLASRCHG